MPVDTDLTVNPTGGTQPSGFLSNPLQALSTIVGLKTQGLEQQSLSNTIYNQQQDIAAKARAGEIIAGSPPGDYDAMTKALQSDPLVSGRLPDMVNSVRTAQSTYLTNRGQVLDQNSKAMQVYLKSLGQVVSSGDVSELPIVMKQNLAALPPEMQKDLAPAFTAAAVGLMHGVGDPKSPEGQARLKQNAVGQMIGAGLDAGTAFGAAGLVPPRIVEGPYGEQGAQKPTQVGGFGTQGGGQGPSGPTKPTETYLGARGTDMADYRKKLDETTLMGGQILKTIQPAWEAIQTGAKPGGGAEFYTKLGQVAQAFGMPQETVDKIANGDLGKSQEFQKLMVNSTMGQIVQQLPAMSRLAVTEFNAFRENNPNLDTDPRAIEKIFNFWTSLYKQSHDEQSQMDKYLSKPGSDVTRWPTIWQDIAQKKGYINTNVTGSAEGGEEKKPRPPISSFFK